MASSRAVARSLFVFVLCLNCIIWSRSRYGVPQASSFLHSREGPSLVRRISQELLNPQAADISNIHLQKECRPLAFPAAQQCAHVRSNCPPPETFLSIHYLQHYYCADLSSRFIVFTALLVWLFFLFSTLGISASDFFTPNLGTIAMLLGLDENVTGVTFLAFGNGSPDMFSTFSALRANSGSLAIGELIGAASFIVSCVVGSMCIIRPFRAHPRPFIRDLGFFTLAVSILLGILWDSKIYPWEAWMMVGLYVVYVVYVLVTSYRDKQRQIREDQIKSERQEYSDDVPILGLEPYRDDPTPSPRDATPTSPRSNFSRSRAISTPVPPTLRTDIPPRPLSTRSPSPTPSGRSQTQIPSFSIRGALEFRDLLASLDEHAAKPSLRPFGSPITPFAGGHYHSRGTSRSQPRSQPRTPRTSMSSRDDYFGDAVPLDERNHPIPLSHNPYTDEPDSDQTLSIAESGRAPLPSIYRTPASPTASSSSDNTSEVTTYVLPSGRGPRLGYIVGRIMHTLFPSLHRFRTQSILGQVVSVFAAPAIMLLTLTLPVVVTPYHDPNSSEKLQSAEGDQALIDFEDESDDEARERVLRAEDAVTQDIHPLTFNKWLMAAQCVCAPLFCIGVLFSGNSHQQWLLLGAGIGGLAIGILVAIFAKNGDHPTTKMAGCSLGFLVAIVWIMAIADEVVNVLQAFGFIFGLSDAIIGLTIFAIGNSLADLVANISVAAFFPLMGFHACFGGPMLNILLGVGLSGSYITHQTGVAYQLDFSPTLMVSTIGLLFLLTATMIFVPRNDYHLTKPWGILLIASYVVIMVINIAVELT